MGVWAPSDFEVFLELGEIPGSVPGDQGEIFEADAADFGVVEAGFDGDHVAGGEAVGGGGAEAGAFVDFEADAVAGAVEEAAHAALFTGGFEAAVAEDAFDGGVDFGSEAVLAEGEQGEFLGFDDGGVHGANAFAGAAADDGSGDIAVVAGALGSGEDVDDDGLVGGEGAVAAFVGVAALAAAGDDGVRGVASGLEDGGGDDTAETFGGEEGVVEDELLVLADAGPAEGVDTFGKADFGHDQRGADLLHFVGGFDGACGEEGAVAKFDFDAAAAQGFGESEGETFGDGDFLDSMVTEDGAEDVDEGGGFGFAVTDQASLILRVREGAAMACFGADAVHLRVVEHDVGTTLAGEPDEWVRDERPDGVQHVGVALAVPNDQEVVFGHGGEPRNPLVERQGRCRWRDTGGFLGVCGRGVVAGVRSGWGWGWSSGFLGPGALP